ncbi:MAG: PHP domain-containing protein [Treponema sp.]|nr:PHP domain-containing protein [Treponema sp.]
MLADLHNHSCLSPCGSLELSPRCLLELGAARGLKLMALTDHNSSLNCPAFAKLSSHYGIIPIFGMEATTTEEVHILCLFTNLDACMAFNEYAYSILTPFLNNPEKTGDQVYVDEEDNIEGEVEYYLINPLDLSLDNIGAKVSEYNGIVIPAHVDRPAFSMTSQLGIVVDGPWTAIECVRIPPAANGLPLNTFNYPLTTSSDAHFCEHVGRRPFELDITLEELLCSNTGAGGYTEANMEVLKQALGRRPRC